MRGYAVDIMYYVRTCGRAKTAKVSLGLSFSGANPGGGGGLWSLMAPLQAQLFN